MRPFYFFLMILWGVLAFYTGKVIGAEGVNLFPTFFGAITDWQWPGQFNLDFTLMLFLSASWTAWRNGFSVGGWVLAIVAFFCGAGFLLPYLTYLSWQHRGDTAAILRGQHSERTA
jgi:hypothetical protein